MLRPHRYRYPRLAVTGLIFGPSLLLLVLIMAHVIPLAAQEQAIIFATPDIPNAFRSPFQLSSDPYTNDGSQHQTEVEPDTYSHGSTIVTAFQVGRFSDSGSSNIGWATSSDGGHTWKNGFLPGITQFAGGPYARVSDPSVAYDPAHDIWIISSLAVVGSGSNLASTAVVVSLSTE